MKKKAIFKTASLSALIFLFYTVLVKTVDVRPIGPDGSSVGFAALNGWIFRNIGIHPFWATATDVLGILAILVAFSFAILGAYQLLTRKSFWKVDFSLRLMGGFYLIAAGFYLFFEKVIINYRPILVEGDLEPSYPSSHTFLFLTILGMAAVEYSYRLRNHQTRQVLCQGFLAALMLAMAIDRLLSGAHWFTDILGGVLLATTVVLFYAAIHRSYQVKKGLVHS